MALDSMHEWLNSEFLEKALNSSEENKLKVISSKIEKATAPGEHCASHIYRASLHTSRDGVEESRSVIVKIELCDAGMGEIINKVNAFQKEIDVYTLVIPNAEKLLEEYTHGKNQPYAPKCYYTYSGPPASVIVMEDLKESGFRLAKHSGGLDINHCLLAINTLASYHAASAVLYAKDSNKMEPLETSLYTEEMRRDVKKLFDPTLRNLAFESETWPECKGEIASKLHELILHSFDYLLNSLKSDEKDFRVLAHEDIRMNNIMFRYSDHGEKPTEVRNQLQLMEKANSTSDPPNWINIDFLRKILSRDGEEGRIISWKTERATLPGENYGSVIYRITVELIIDNKTENKSLIVKVELTTEELAKFVSEGNAFVREIQAYATVLPQIQNMLQKALPKKFKPFVPKCYYTHVGLPGSVLVFEDLKKVNFKLAERSVGLDLKHSLLVIRNLAMYHASSVVLYEKQPHLIEPFMSGVYQKNNIVLLKTLVTTVFKDLADEVEKWPGYKDRFSDKLRKIVDKGVDIILDGVARDEDDFNVLAHEDPWLNNIMFRYSEDTGEVDELRLLDFQSCHWTAPAVDIQRYLLSTATAEVVQQHHFILEEYFKVLQDTLDLLDHKHLCPNIDHLKKQMDRRAMFGFVIAVITMAFFLADPDEMPDIDKVIRNEARVKFGKLFKEAIRNLLPVLEENNWI